MSRSNKRALFWPIAAIFGLSLVAGTVAVLLQLHVARALLQLVLQPGGTVALLQEEPETMILFPLRLFGLAFLAVAACAVTSWALAGTRSKAGMFLLLFGASLLLTAFAFWTYRASMQEKVDLSVGGQVLARTKGQLTRLGDVPIFKLGMLGPLIVCAGTIAIRRRKEVRKQSAG